MFWVDYVIIGIISVSAIISVVRGFVKEVLSLLAWALSIWVAFNFSEPLSPLLSEYISTESIRLIAAFTTLFLITLILSALVNHIISTIVEKTGLSGLLAGTTPIPNDTWWQNAVLIEHFEKIAVWVQQFLPDGLAEYVHFN